MFIFPHPPRESSTPRPTENPRLRAAAVAVCLAPLLGITAAAAALLLGAAAPGPAGWAVGAALLVAHAVLTRAVARRAPDNRPPPQAVPSHLRPDRPMKPIGLAALQPTTGAPPMHPLDSPANTTRPRSNRGLALPELVIMLVALGVVAAVAVPRLSRASAPTPPTVRADLAVLRNAIELYAADHGGDYPDLAAFTQQLTGVTDPAGQPAPQGLGPYLVDIPALPTGPRVGETPRPQRLRLSSARLRRRTRPRPRRRPGRGGSTTPTRVGSGPTTQPGSSSPLKNLAGLRPAKTTLTSLTKLHCSYG